MLLLASLFRPVFLPAHSALFKAGESYTLDSSAFVIFDGEVVVTEAEEIDSPGPGPAGDAAAAGAHSHPHSQLVQRGACVGESALFFSAGTPRRLSIGGGGGEQSPAQTQAGSANSAAAAGGRTLVSAPTGTRSGTARTTRPCVLFQLSRRAYVACADFLMATGGDVVRGWSSTVTGMSGNECGVVCGGRDEGWRSDKAASGIRSEACSQSERRSATSTACAVKVEKHTRRINKAEM